MYAQVYYHHTNVVANGMLQRAIKVAVRDRVVDVENLRNGKDDFLEHYLALDDARLLAQVLTRPEGTAADLVTRLERRELFKRGYESNVSQEGITFSGTSSGQSSPRRGHGRSKRRSRRSADAIPTTSSPIW